MNKNKTILLVFLFILVFIIVIFVSYNSKNQNKNLDAFAQCLTEKGLKVFGIKNCSWCQKQKNDFGSSFKYLNYIECDIDPKTCLENKIEATPTWILPDNQKIVGYQTLEQLSKLSQCPLVQN